MQEILITLRTAFLSNNSNIKCIEGGFVPEKELYSNYESLVQYFNVDNISTEVVASLSKETIEFGGVMFSLLNSCPSLYERLYYTIIYGSPSQSSLVTSALNIGRKGNKEFQPRALKILSKMLLVLGFDHIQYSSESLKVNSLLQTVSNHPVHILTEKAEFSPSSFIPFCSFGEDPIGTKIADFDVPICDIFRPRVRNDQLCYETDLEEMRSKDINKAKKQLEIGLVLIVDYNVNRQLFYELTKQSEKRFYFNYNDDNSVSLFFNTISKKKPFKLRRSSSRSTNVCLSVCPWSIIR